MESIIAYKSLNGEIYVKKADAEKADNVFIKNNPVVKKVKTVKANGQPSIRQQIERISRQHIKSVFCEATNKDKTKYRMKLCCSSPLTAKQIAEVKEITSHIIEVGYAKSPSKSYNCGWYDGITVYFDCKPSTIVL
jgi:hypothetical protein